MKIVEDYARDVAKREVEKSKKPIILDLLNEGYNLEDIARIAHVNLDFVKETLSK